MAAPQDVTITYNRCITEPDRLPADIATAIPKLRAALRCLPKDYHDMLRAWKVPVDIAPELDEMTLGQGGFMGPKINPVLFKDKSHHANSLFQVLREEVVHTLDSRLNNFTSRREWRDASDADSQSLRAKVVLQLQRYSEDFNKRSPTSEEYSKDGITHIEMLPELVAADAMFKHCKIWDHVVLHQERVGMDSYVDAVAEAHDMNNDFDRETIRDQAIRSFLYARVSLQVLGLDDALAKIEKQSGYDSIARDAKINELFQQTARTQRGQLDKISDLIDYYLDNEHGKTPAQLMGRSLPAPLSRISEI